MLWQRYRFDQNVGKEMIQLQFFVCSSAALGNAAARASACSCLEVVIQGGDKGSVSLVVSVEKDAELESRALCLVVFGSDDRTSSFRLRYSDMQASEELPRRCMMFPEAKR